MIAAYSTYSGTVRYPRMSARMGGTNAPRTVGVNKCYHALCYHMHVLAIAVPQCGHHRLASAFWTLSLRQRGRPPHPRVGLAPYATVLGPNFLTVSEATARYAEFLG